MVSPRGSVSGLLVGLRAGDSQALAQLMPVVYSHLRQIAAARLGSEQGNQTIQPTGLVHEVYLRLAGAEVLAADDRAHFFALASRMMRQVLMDRARTRCRLKRGGRAIRIPLEDNLAIAPNRCIELLALDEALARLAEVDERKCRVVEMRYFGGLDVEEVSAVLGVSCNTVIRDWKIARAWLRRELSRTRDAG